MKVLHVAETIKGGVETYLRQLCDCQQRNGIEPYLLCNENVSWLDASKQISFSREARGLRALWQLAKSYRRALRDFDVDVIHLHGTFAGLIGRLPTMSPANKPLIYCAHGWAYDRGDGLFRYAYMAVEWSLSFLCDSVVAISAHDADAYVGAKNKLSLIENAVVDLYPSPPAQPSRKTLLFVGRLDRQKGVDLLLQAYANHDFDFELLVVGEAVLGDIELGQVPDGVKFLGWLDQDEFIALYSEVSALIAPSRWEGFGLVAIEAMSASKTILAANVGGLTRLVDGSGGYLFDSTYEGVAAALKHFDALSCEELALAGQKARAFYETNYRIERLELELRQLYQQLLKQSTSMA
ncbi:glycosyltransferase family 4 protein [Agaribacterium haliotis]|uniref:glycosyltransferase family 4 protein n=1 Tax=Agaribacterium haliotis TaxID=2013869 RepID=UPI000BB53420|nr:glycosyltransferase family 4 protein [Agaribacterium haliotis]